VRRIGMKIILACLFAGCLYGALQAKAQTAQTQTQGRPSKASPKTSKTASGSGNEGEMRFEAHCGRCHNPPEDLSPREARAVVRQMRVRAMLSAEDERLILKYIAP
jgi:cytochrome c5